MIDIPDRPDTFESPDGGFATIDEMAAFMGEPDLAVCPHCGKRDFRLVSEEHVYGYLSIALLPDGKAEWYGATEMAWDSSQTTSYLCLDCQMVLPESYAQELDRLLGNTRQVNQVSETFQYMGEE